MITLLDGVAGGEWRGGLGKTFGLNIRILIESYVCPEVDDEGNVVRGDAGEL